MDPERFDMSAAMRELGFLDTGDNDTVGLDRLLDALGVDPATVGAPEAEKARVGMAWRLFLFDVVSLVVPLGPNEDQEWISRLHAATTATDDALISALTHPDVDLRRLAACAVAYTRGTGPAVLDAIRARLEREHDASVRLQLLVALGGHALESAETGAEVAEIHAELRRLIGTEHDSVTRLGAALGLLRAIGGDRVAEHEHPVSSIFDLQPHNVADDEVDDDLIDALAECVGPGGEALYRLPARLEWEHPVRVVVEHWTLTPRTRVRLLAVLLARLEADPAPDLDLARPVPYLARQACDHGIDGAEPLATALSGLLDRQRNGSGRRGDA
ncbi:hypothetical protein [Nocardiopsis synnemataformans]|uniref:hypothetical protein n=1 Tax=Nocardiopsis synnemataformans TaxID=61305 RepID=UPI003EB82418